MTKLDVVDIVFFMRFVPKSQTRSQLISVRPFLLAFGAAIAALSASCPPAFGEALTVNSSTDGKGLYTYSFSRGSEPYVWGLTTNGSAIYLQSYGVTETTQPPNSTASLETNGQIIWSVTNGIVYLEDPVTVTVRSIFTTARTYNGWIYDPNTFMKGLVSGEVYGVGDHQPLAGGIESFEFVGPDPTALTIHQVDNSVVVGWYSALTNCQLQATTTLSDSNSWSPVTNVPVVVGDRNFVTNSVSATSRLYRLKF